MIYLASDHGGFDLKEALKGFLKNEKFKFTDLGPKKFNKEDDYPDFAQMVAEKISKNPNTDLGILICRSGQGMAIAANKFKNVRAALVWNNIEAIMSRQDDMTNVLCLPAQFLSRDTAFHLVLKWLETPWGKQERHKRRIEKISNWEK